jgi:hypothetical protein
VYLCLSRSHSTWHVVDGNRTTIVAGFGIGPAHLGSGVLPIYVRPCFLEGSQDSPVCAAGKRDIKVGQRRGGAAALCSLGRAMFNVV